jgi:hypothetical protein
MEQGRTDFKHELGLQPFSLFLHLSFYLLLLGICFLFGSLYFRDLCCMILRCLEFIG